MSDELRRRDDGDLVLRDETARRNLEVTRAEIANGAHYAIPWLDLDAEAYCAYRERRTDRLPEPYCDDPVDRIMMADVQGREVLCLAGGGGQQSAVFSLLGAAVTVLDLCPEQLESDQKAARHYGYEVATIQGDMRDLSIFPGECFDRVYQPISTLYVPDLRELYAGVARVLKPGGLYFADYCVPLLGLVESPGWDGTGYPLLITQPYMRGAIFEIEGKQNLTAGESFGEFHHLLSDIINGLIAEGLVIRGLWENPRPDDGPPLADLEPGSKEHMERHLLFGLSVVARKGGA
jgi:SAM-dependent methyltransferase